MEIYKSDYSHPGGIPRNEDTCLCRVLSPQSAYAAAAGGYSGTAADTTASKITAAHLSACERCQGLPGPEQIRQWLLNANQDLLARQMKATAVFLAVQGNRAIWAHIGDCRLYHYHNGVLTDQTLDHSVAQSQVAAHQISRSQIPGNPDRKRLLNLLGSQEAAPEVHAPVTLQPGLHAFLLCTDGFWEYLRDLEIGMDLMKSRNPEAWLTYLRCRGETRKGEGADNNSAAAMWIRI